MSAAEPLCYLIGINPKNFSKEENKLLEGDLFARICNELKKVFKQQYTDFFDLMQFTVTMEEDMLERNFIRDLINDILSTGGYTLQGVAYYTDTHADIIQDLASGLNTKPLAICLRKVIELHRSVRCELYQALGKKIASEYISNSLKINN